MAANAAAAAAAFAFAAVAAVAAKKESCSDSGLALDYCCPHPRDTAIRAVTSSYLAQPKGFYCADLRSTLCLLNCTTGASQWF
jgi:hypothetical protein